MDTASDPGGYGDARQPRGRIHYIFERPSKCWIGNASIADVKNKVGMGERRRWVVVGGFVVGRKGRRAWGFAAKRLLRESSSLAHVAPRPNAGSKIARIPAENRLPKASGLKAPLSCLSQGTGGRGLGRNWRGRSIATRPRWPTPNHGSSFGRPIAGFQLVQEKLVWMVQDRREITKAQLLALRLTRMMESGPGPARNRSRWRKRNNVWIGAGMCAYKARDLLGARGHHLIVYSVVRQSDEP